MYTLSTASSKMTRSAPQSEPIPVVFLGSFLEYSALVLHALASSPLLNVVGVITTPPMPAGRKQELKKTEVHRLAETLNLPVATPDQLTPESLATTAQTLRLTTPPPIFITAGYGKLLPAEWLSYPSVGALNLHFSLLPAYRGANPAEWALLKGENQTGVSVITMSPQFDTGAVLASANQAITATDTRETIYQKLYQLGGQLLPQVIVDFVAGKLSAQPQPTTSPTPYAKRFTRDDSFVAWEGIAATMAGQTATTQQLAPLLAQAIKPVWAASTLSSGTTEASITPGDLERATRALAGFPGLWTLIPTAKGPTRMKLLKTSLAINGQGKQVLQLDLVQVAGQQPAAWNQVRTILK